MRRLLRHGVGTPVVHFVLLGAVLFGAQRWWGSAVSAPPPSIFVSQSTVDSLRRAWHEQFGREPDAAEVRMLVAQNVDEEILYREALASGFDRDDRIVRARLADLARFLDVAPGDADPAVLENAARQLGLDQRDVIVRRHLAELSRLALAKGTPLESPSESELRAYYDTHLKRFAQPARVQLTQVYLSAQQRGAGLNDAAATLLDRLRGEGIDPQQAAALGDPFIRGARLPLSSRSEIERAFGPSFANAVASAAPRAWIGPVRSSYGLHLVWIEHRTPARPAEFATVRNQVAHAFLRERQEQRLAQRLASLRSRYRIVSE